jgi:hypothetical protein
MDPVANSGIEELSESPPRLSQRDQLLIEATAAEIARRMNRLFLGWFGGLVALGLILTFASGLLDVDLMVPRAGSRVQSVPQMTEEERARSRRELSPAQQKRLKELDRTPSDEELNRRMKEFVNSPSK